MANQEEALKRAIAGGDAIEINKRHAEYVESMEQHHQKPRPLSDFRR